MWWPLSGWGLAVGAFALVTRRGVKRLATLGSARWASAREMRRAGMLGGDSGLIIGRVKTRYGRAKLIRLRGAVHSVVVAPTGAGKGVSCTVPYLLTSRESCVVLDYKGENAKLTAEHRRRRFGHDVVLLDPYRVVTQSPDAFNPLDFIDKDSPLALDDCNDLANALVVRKETENEPHWNDSAEAVIAAVIAVVVAHGDAAKRAVLQVLNEASNAPHFFDLSGGERLAFMIERAFALGAASVKQSPRGRGQRRPRRVRDRER